MEENSSESATDDAQPGRGIRERCCSWGPGWKTITWLVVVIVYLLLGGLIFTLAERRNEIDSVDAVVAERERLRQLLEDGKAAALATFGGNSCNSTTREAARELIERVSNVSFSLALASQEVQAEKSPLWTYSPSVFFSATVITTIGILYMIFRPISLARLHLSNNLSVFRRLREHSSGDGRRTHSVHFLCHSRHPHLSGIPRSGRRPPL